LIIDNVEISPHRQFPNHSTRKPFWTVLTMESQLNKTQEQQLPYTIMQVDKIKRLTN